MIEYHYKGSGRFAFAAMFLLYGGVATMTVLAPFLSPAGFHSTGERIGLLPMAFLLACAACWGLLGLLNTFNVYRLDASRIVKRHWNGREQEFGWRAVVNVETSRRSVMTLTDFRGERMSVPPPSYGYRSKSGQDLCAVLDEHLATIQANLPSQSGDAREFRVGSSASVIAAGFVSVFAIGLGVGLPLSPLSTQAPATVLVGIPIVCFAIALYFAYMAVRQATRVITVTETLIQDRTLFSTREIPFAHIRSMTTREVQGKSTTIEATTVRSAATSISFSSAGPNYDRLVAALRAQVGRDVEENSPQAIQADSR